MTAAAGIFRRPPGISLSSPRLPLIPRSQFRLGAPEISLREKNDRDPADQTNQGRPLPQEQIPTRPSRSSSSLTQRSMPEIGRMNRIPLQLNIPEGVQVKVATDPGKVRLPVFGQRADVVSRAESRISLASSKATHLSRPGTHLRIEVDELEHLLHEKLRSGGFFTLRQFFRRNDSKGKGQVSKEVLLMILTKFLGRFISSKQYHLLLLRLKLHEKTAIKFEEFAAKLQDPSPSGFPTWLDPVIRKNTERFRMTASQVHAQLKERAKQRFLDLAELIPQKNPGGATRILEPEFRNMLNYLGFHMEEEEFNKLWKRYDTEGTGVVKGDVLLKKLGIEFRSESTSQSDSTGHKSCDEKSSEDGKKSSRLLSKAEQERKASLTIEKWLKDKFREGFKSWKEEFEKRDPQKTGKVQKEDFLSVLENFNLHLREDHFNLFLARCGLENSQDGISYLEFLRNFQDRSDKGITHKILSNPNHTFHREGRNSPASSVSAIEAELTNMFQADFLSLLASFQKIDKQERDVISQQEFRAAIESRFGVEITEEEFELLLDRIPLDGDGNVRYPQFMAMFDTRKGAPSLFGEKTVIHPLHKHREEKEKQTQTHESYYNKEWQGGRTPRQLFKIIKSLLSKQYQAVEKELEDLDEMNSRRLTQEMMYLLLKRFDIHPEITRGEISRLWETLITNQDKTLDFLEFVRHFGYSLKSACFPNAKVSPPKKGDGNFQIRSRKLNSDSDILVDRLRAKVDYLWDDLRKEFLELDPYNTGFVSKEEFKDILSELCVQLNEYECDLLEKKFEINGDGRVSYVEFLKPFAMRRQAWNNGYNMAMALQHQRAAGGLYQDENRATGLGALKTRLRNKLCGEWKTLRRAFKKLDNDSSGYLSLAEFKSVLRLCNFLLNEEEVYHIMAKFDQNMDGRIDYKNFIEETFKKIPIAAKNK
nr:PREDICTED: EF-hand calcium-binding domain-containing protein 6-like [Latimeria chalumnae]|eukprot:XP_014353279.1 PREDICTED: EF-hand calcium-binding domain-containing protein 6-like [Latimeria chalumnae]